MERVEDQICLDSDFLVNFLRNKPEEKEFIRQHEDTDILATTFINLFELYYGAYKSGVYENILRVDELQRRLKIIPLSKETVKRAGEVLAELEKRGEPIDFRDLLIGCAAQVEGFGIKTYRETR